MISLSSPTQLTPRGIYKLYSDCFDHIFDFLDLNDVASFGQTCVAAQNIAGEYFKRNFKSAQKFIHNDSIVMPTIGSSGHIKISIFNQIINSIALFHTNLNEVLYIERNIDKFSSLSEIRFECFHLNESIVQGLRALLPRIEILTLRQCSIEGDLYEVLLQYCQSIKEIRIEDDNGQIICPNNNPWLLRKFPALETIRLTHQPEVNVEIDELLTFFNQNPNIHTFSTTSNLIWTNRDKLKQCNAKFNELEIHCKQFDASFCSLLNELHGKKFYRRLHLVGSGSENLNLMISLSGLESLTLMYFHGNDTLSRLVDLKKLIIHKSDGGFDGIARNLVNLRCLSLPEMDDVMPFIQHSKKLKQIKSNWRCEVDGKVDLTTSNQVREQLHGACKLILYLTDISFLDAKWSMRNLDTGLIFIEIRRATSIYY